MQWSASNCQDGTWGRNDVSGRRSAWNTFLFRWRTSCFSYGSRRRYGVRIHAQKRRQSYTVESASYRSGRTCRVCAADHQSDTDNIRKLSSDVESWHFKKESCTAWPSDFPSGSRYGRICQRRNQCNRWLLCIWKRTGKWKFCFWFWYYKIKCTYVRYRTRRNWSLWYSAWWIRHSDRIWRYWKYSCLPFDRRPRTGSRTACECTCRDPQTFSDRRNRTSESGIYWSSGSDQPTGCFLCR